MITAGRELKLLQNVPKRTFQITRNFFVFEKDSSR